MPPASNESQFKFLISCIRYSNNGKVDFGEVARECDIVTKGAAAKRYERMMKAHGIAPNAATVKPARSTTKSERSSSSNTGNAKKRKMDAYADDGGAEDDVEDFGPGPIKNDPDQLRIKEEAAQQAFEQLDMVSFNPSMGVGLSDTSFGDHQFGTGENFIVNSPFSSNGDYMTPNDSSFGGMAPRSYMDFGNYDNTQNLQLRSGDSESVEHQPIVIGD